MITVHTGYRTPANGCMAAAGDGLCPYVATHQVTIRTVDGEMHTAVDPVALARQAYAAEMLLQRALILVDEMLPLARTRAHQNDLLDLLNLLTGKAK